MNTRVIQQLVGMVSSDPEASAWRLEGLGLRQCQLPPGRNLYGWSCGIPHGMFSILFVLKFKAGVVFPCSSC